MIEISVTGWIVHMLAVKVLSCTPRGLGLQTLEASLRKTGSIDLIVFFLGYFGIGLHILFMSGLPCRALEAGVSERVPVCSCSFFSRPTPIGGP